MCSNLYVTNKALTVCSLSILHEWLFLCVSTGNNCVVYKWPFIIKARLLLDIIYYLKNNMNIILSKYRGDTNWNHNLRNLEELDLARNKLVGIVPAAIFNVSTLKHLGLQDNSLLGCLSSIGDVRLPNLEGLYLSGNNFSGTIPSFIFNASKLFKLSLQRNSFFGFTPNTFGNLRNLKWLSLYDS